LLVQARRRGVVVRDVAALATASRASLESALAFTARETGPPQFSALALSPADELWAWGSPNGEVQIRKTDNAAADGPPLVVEGGMRIDSLAFSPNRKTLAVAGGNGPIVLWDVAARRPVDEPLREASAASMAFTSDGRFLVTRSGQGELEWWSTDGGAWADRLCAIVGRRFTEREWTTYIGTTDVDNAACMPGSR
jgi:WD40 repeat protein